MKNQKIKEETKNGLMLIIEEQKETIDQLNIKIFQLLRYKETYDKNKLDLLEMLCNQDVFLMNYKKS